MFTLHRLITWMLILVSPARLVAAIPLTLPAQVHAQSANAPYILTLDQKKVEAVTVTVAAKPDFDADVIAPLKAAQAKQAADEAAAAEAAKAAAATKVTPVIVAGDDAYAQLRLCEAGGDYTRNSGNGYFGAYQYDLRTWGNYGGFARADLAPASVQDEKIHADVARRGFSPWPACARKLGLL